MTVSKIVKKYETHELETLVSILGHPIVNDYLYNTTAWGPSKGKGGDYGKSDEKVRDLTVTH